jgi:hypothetical protein
LEDETVEGVKDRIVEASLLSEGRCRDLASEAVRLASTVHTQEVFSQRVHAHLAEVLGDV